MTCGCICNGHYRVPTILHSHLTINVEMFEVPGKLRVLLFESLLFETKNQAIQKTSNQVPRLLRTVSQKEFGKTMTP